MTHLGDITKIDWFHVPPADVVTGGSPCQDLSVTGKRAGLAGERSGLYMEQIRCVKELRQADEQRGRTGIAIRPRYMVWENVPGAFSSNGGEDFRAVLEEAAKIAQPDAVIPRPPKSKWTNSGAIMGDGWSIAWRVHDAQFWGVPQRRRRISVVCDFGGQSAPEVLFERKGMSGDSEPGGTAREETAGAAGGGVASTITATYGTKWNGNAGAYSGGNFVIEPVGGGAEGASIDGTYPTVARSLTQRYDGSPCIDRGPDVVVQNAEPAVMAFAQNQVGEVRVSSMSGTLNTNSNASGRNSPLVYDARGNGDGKAVASGTNQVPAVVTTSGMDVADTLDASYYKGTGSRNGKERTVLCVGNGQLHQMSMSEQANTLDTMHDQQAVMVSAVDCRNLNEHQEVSGTLQCKQNGGYSLNYQNPIMVQGAYKNAEIRRLTPLEVERLQGYPDGWTDIGEWVDSKGKRHKDADSPRYKALGNSIALPFWFWLLRRISAQYIGPATLGSLFDGIGGFPLCWERCNGKGTALWASEIEEFPMAVTRRYFGEDEWHDIEIFEKWAQEEEGL